MGNRMKTIWKYELNAEGKQEIQLPLGAKFLTVQIQNDKPCLWALVDTEVPKITETILIFGTGHAVTGEGEYLGTYQLHGGILVFHVFYGRQ